MCDNCGFWLNDISTILLLICLRIPLLQSGSNFRLKTQYLTAARQDNIYSDIMWLPKNLRACTYIKPVALIKIDKIKFLNYYYYIIKTKLWVQITS